VITGVIGPSGCGKSTLMRSVAGVQLIASGTVTVLGSPAGSAALRGRIGYATQAPAVYADLTVRENLQYFAAVQGVPASQITAVLDAVRQGPGAEPVMNLAITRATAVRVLSQLRHDPRTIAMLVVVPTVLLIVLRYMLNSRQAFDRTAPMLLGLFPFVVMFLVTSVATLRERRTGTLERLMTMPMTKLDFLIGYGVAFGAIAIVQVAVVATVTLTWLGLTIAGNIWMLLLATVLSALLGTTLGLAVSAFARSEFQAVQFMPVFVLPQALLSGLFVPRADMARWLQLISDVLPLTYAVDATTRVTTMEVIGSGLIKDLAITFGCVLLAIVAGATTLRRRTG
jgi:ABC-2 type transport system permease protein